MRRFLPRPHQIILLIGALAALGTLASGIAPEITEWHDSSRISREVFINIPAPLEVAFYLAVATGLFLVAWLVSLRVQNYERGKPDDRRTNKGNAKRRMRGLPQGRLDAHAAAGSRRRRHALVHLLRVPGPVHRHRPSRDRPPAAGFAEVPARPHLPGVRVHRRPVRPRLPRRHPLGVRPPVRAAALPDPHQDQARAPRHPRDVPRHRGHRLHHRGVPDRRPARGRRAAGGLREVVLRRLGALRRSSKGWTLGGLHDAAPLVVGHPRRSRSSRSW